MVPKSDYSYNPIGSESSVADDERNLGAMIGHGDQRLLVWMGV